VRKCRVIGCNGKVGDWIVGPAVCSACAIAGEDVSLSKAELKKLKREERRAEREKSNVEGLGKTL